MAKKRPARQSHPVHVGVRAAPGDKCRAILSIGGLAIRAALGRSGRSAFKREGDGATPIAPLRLVSGYWRPDRGPKPVTSLPLTPIRPGLVWCDAPGHPLYNRPSPRAVPASAETMMREDHLYDICIVLDWNLTRRARHRGSAIFLHLARPGYRPTEGCIALARRDMERLLRVIGPGSILHVT